MTSNNDFYELLFNFENKWTYITYICGSESSLLYLSNRSFTICKSTQRGRWLIKQLINNFFVYHSETNKQRMNKEGKIVGVRVTQTLYDEDDDIFMSYSVHMNISNVLTLSVHDFQGFPTLDQLLGNDSWCTHCGGNSHYSCCKNENFLEFKSCVSGSGGDSEVVISLELNNEHLNYLREICKIKQLEKNSSAERYSYNGDLNIVVE